MALAELESILDVLKADSQSKKNVYTQLQSCIDSQPLTSIPEDRLLAVIKRHLKENIMINEALATWILYTRKSKSITEDFIENVYDHSKNFDLLVPLFCELLTENLLDLEKILSNNSIDLKKQVINSLIAISDKVTFETYFNFINNDVRKIIYTTNSDETRNMLIEFVLSKHSTYPLTSYSSKELKEIATIFKNSYVQVIDNLRVQNNKNWYKLCMFTMKYCGKLLHSEIELTNAILRNVEIGFKTKTIQDRLMSYECWKVLIDICNLDPAYICSTKQLRLLVKPLKVKLSKNEEIIHKRFEVWFYLIQILQEKLMLCLEEFIKFCFELSSNNSISEICVECEMIKNTWIKRVEVLMAIIGHSDHEESCLKIKNFNFKSHLVTSTNFLEYDELLINSIYVACKMCSTWDDNADKVKKVKCLWGTLFKITQNLNENSKESILHKISKVLNLLLQDSVNNARIFDDVVIPIFSLLSNFEEPICNSLLLHEIIIFPIIRFMLSQQTVRTEWSKEVVNLIRNVPKTGNKLFYFNRVCELLKTSSCTNNMFIVYFWLQLSEELYDICKTPREGFSDFKEDAMYFLTRIFSCNSFDDMQNAILCKWRSIFSEICAISTVFGEDLLENSEKLLKKQPGTINNLLLFLPDISEVLLESKSPKKHVVGLLNVIFYCLQNPCTPKDKIIMTVVVLKKVLTFCLNSDHVETEAVVSRIYECIEYLLKPHEVLEIVEVLKDIVSKLTDNTRKNIPNSLKQILNELTLNSDTLISKDAIAILAQLDIPERGDEPKPLFVKPITVSARTAKIANMAKDNGFTTSPKGSMLKMFANDQKNNKKDINGTNKCNSPGSRTKKMIKAVPSRLGDKIKSVDEDSREFVLIDKEIKPDKKKMNEHQRQIMNKRREDIPAMYQDLSQSQNSNGDISSSISNDGASSNKSDSMLDENFKEIITDLKNKNNILQETLNAELIETIRVDNQSKSINPESSVSASSKDSVSIHENGLPKYDLNVNFEKALENERNEITSYDDKILNRNQPTNHGREASKNTPVFCSSKFEEKNVKTEAAQAPIFPEHNYEGMCVRSDKSLKKRHKYKPDSTSTDSDKRKEMKIPSDIDMRKNQLLRNRSISDSHLTLETSDMSVYEFGSDDDLLENVELAKENLEKNSKQLKTKALETKMSVRNKRKKSPFSNKQNKTLKYIRERRRRKSYEESYKNDLQANCELKKKCKSLENLNDMARKRKKCFKIIHNDSELSNSIKLRISITDEKDTNPGSDILVQLDTEISKIDANLKNSELLLPCKADPVNSESLFGSSEALFDPTCSKANLDNVEANRGEEYVNSKVEVLSKTNTVDERAIIVDSESKVEQLDGSFSLKKSGNENVMTTQRRKQRELERIKMDIVGADEFIVTTPRKRRAPKLLDSVLYKGTSRNKTPAKTATENLTPQPASPQKRGHKKKSSYEKSSTEVSENDETPNNEMLKKSISPNSSMTPKTAGRSLQLGLSNRRKRKTNTTHLQEHIENATKTDDITKANENNEELLCKSYEEIVDLSDASAVKNSSTPVKSKTKSLKGKSKLRPTNEVLEGTPELVGTPKRKGGKNRTKTPITSPLLGPSQPRVTARRKGYKDVNKNSVKSSKRSASAVVEDSTSSHQEVVENNILENSENIIESSQDTRELITLSSRSLRRSQKTIAKGNGVSSMQESVSSSILNITDDCLNSKPIDQDVKSQATDKNDERIESQNEEIFSKPVSSDASEAQKSPEQDSYICEINGVAIGNLNSEGCDEICTGQTYSGDADDTEITSVEINTLDQPDNLVATDDEIIDNNIETDDESENMQIKEEITIVNHNVMDYYKSYISIKIDKDPIEDDKPIALEQDMKDNVKPIVTKIASIKAESIDQDETLTCDPYTNINNDKEFLDKMESDVPGAIRTVIRDLNFDSLPIVFETTPKKGNIPGSPVCEDTPDRNKEFLKNTLDISPIKTETISIEVSEKDAKTPVISDRSYIKQPSSRSAKLLNLLPCNTEITPLKSSKMQFKKAAPSPEASTTPSTERIRKMILNCGKIPQATAAVKEEDDVTFVEDIACKNTTMTINVFSENAILKFTRELPSPLATPNSSILKKRKLSEIDETTIPLAKRPKRVNFSDPPTTCKKIYFMENDEKSDDSNDAVPESSFSIMANLKLAKANSIYPRLTTCTEDIQEIITLIDEDVLSHFHSINVKTIGDLANLNETQINRLEFLAEPRLPRILDALDIFYSNYTEKDKAWTDKVASAIYPNLIDCTHSIQNVLKFVGNARTAKDFRLKGIVTIGDLAKLTKTEIAQFSLKPLNVLNALHKYQRKLNKGKILARQMEEEMNEEKAAGSDLDGTNVSQSSDANNSLDVLEVKEIKADIDLIPDRVIDASLQEEKRTKEQKLNELIQHIKENCSIDEMRIIFDELKDILFKH